MTGKTLCVDFDGVIHSYRSGWQGPEVIPDDAVPGALPWLIALINKGYRVCIYSSRSGQQGGVGAMQSWFLRQAEDLGIPNAGQALLDHLEFPTRKPAAYLTIDDRCICFRGTFPDTMEIEAFKPWHSKEV